MYGAAVTPGSIVHDGVRHKLGRRASRRLKFENMHYVEISHVVFAVSTQVVTFSALLEGDDHVRGGVTSILQHTLVVDELGQASA